MSKTLPKITVDGQETPFCEFIKDMAGTGFIFNEDCEEIINKAAAGELDWIAVDDYFGPITSELLVESAQEDKDVFDQLTLAIKSAFYKLKERREKEEFKQLQKRVANLEEFIASIDETENCEEYIREFIERS